MTEDVSCARHVHAVATRLDGGQTPYCSISFITMQHSDAWHLEVKVIGDDAHGKTAPVSVDSGRQPPYVRRSVLDAPSSKGKLEPCSTLTMT